MTKTFSGVLMEAHGAFGGHTPNIPIPDAVRDAVLGEMKDPDPMYVTLPIGKVDAKSRNGRTYPRTAMEAMVAAINTHHPSGQLGHLREADRPYAFNVGPLKWMGAHIESDGSVWGKAYVYPFAEDVRQYIKMAKITRSPIGTSLYGMGETDDDDRVISLQVESIDLVDPSRVGVREAAVVPTITSEMVDPTRAADEATPKPDTPQPKDISMDTTLPTTTPVAAPVPAVPAAPVSETAMQRQHTEEKRVLNETITKLNNDLKDFQQIVGELGNPEDPVTAFRLVKEKLAQTERENTALLQETMESKVKDTIKVPTVQPIVLSMLKGKKPTTRAKVEQMLTEIANSPEIADLLKEQVVIESGPAHQRPATPPDKKTDMQADGFFIPGY